MTQHDSGTDAHQEYLKETERLIDEHVSALFSLVQEASDGLASSGQSLIHQEKRRCTITVGERSATFTVQAITDLQDSAERALKFSSGQAYCTLSRPDSDDLRWVLRRITFGSALPVYAWMDVGGETALSSKVLSSLLQLV